MLTTPYYIKILYVFTVWFSFVSFAHADLRITEIMYDPPNTLGTDAVAEYIEIINTSETPVTITSDYKLSLGTLKSLTSYKGGTVIPPKAVAYIVDNGSTFPKTSEVSIVFNATFSLVNTGTTVSLMNGTQTLHTVTYSPMTQTNGNGHSLHISASGVITSAEPTWNTQTFESTSVSSGNTQAISSGGGGIIYTPSFALESIPSIILAGTEVPFLLKRKYSQMNREDPEYAIWNFGDGKTTKGFAVTHTYMHPGEYVVAATRAGSNDAGTPDVYTQKVHVVDPSFTLNNISPTVMKITNNATVKINMSGWKILSDYYEYIFPAHTYIDARASIVIDTEVALITPISLLSNKNYEMASLKSIQIPPSRVISKPVSSARESTKIQKPIVSLTTTPILFTEQLTDAQKTTQITDDKKRNFTKPTSRTIILWGILFTALLVLVSALLYSISRKKHSTEKLQKTKKKNIKNNDNSNVDEKNENKNNFDIFY